MHRTLGYSLAAIIVSLLVTCGGEGPSRVFLSIGTAPPGGAFFVVGSALAEVLNNAGADRGFSVTAEATSGSQENIRRLASGELDFALSNAAITYFAIRGTEGWNQAYSLRTVMTLAPNVAMFVTRADSGIERLSDLSGRRVTVGPAGAGFEYFVSPLLHAHGISYDDFTPLNASQQAAVDMLTDGSADAAFLGGAVPTASITQAAASMDIALNPIRGRRETESGRPVPVLPSRDHTRRNVPEPDRTVRRTQRRIHASHHICRRLRRTRLRRDEADLRQPQPSGREARRWSRDQSHQRRQ